MSYQKEINKSQENQENEEINKIKQNESIKKSSSRVSGKSMSEKNSENNNKNIEENPNINKQEIHLTDKPDIENNEDNNKLVEQVKSQNINNDNNEIINNNHNEDEKEDITNIKYVTKEELEEINKKEEKNKNDNLNNNNLITIKDLQQNPKEKLIINSPRSLKALYDSGYSLNQLYYKTFDEFLLEHTEVMHIDEEARINRYHFYEQLRMNKIDNLVQYREQLIEEEILLQKNKEINIEEGDKIKPMKSIILDNDKRIAKEEIDIIKKKHDKELANIIQLELDKELFNLEMSKQEDNYIKEYQKLNFMNFNSTKDDNEQNEEMRIEEQNNNKIQISIEEPINTYVSISSKINKNYKSLSLPKKPKILDLNGNTYLDNLYSLQQTLVNQKFEKNQKKILQKLERLEKVRKITGEQRALKKRIGVERAAQNLQKNAIDFKIKHEELVKEIQNKKLNIYQNKKKYENLIKNKNEWNNLKYLVKMDFIEDLKRQDENLRMIKYAEFLQKRSTIDKIKNDRLDVIDKKLQKIEILNNQRKKNISKIKNILNNGISEDNLEKIMNKFPLNKDIYNVIENYKKQKDKIMKNDYKITQSVKNKKRPKSHGKIYLGKSNKNKDEYKLNNIKSEKLSNIDKNIKNYEGNKPLSDTNKISNESEIRDKIRLYRNLVYNQFYKKVEEEKLNEEMRLKELEKIEDKNKRYKLEKKFRKERALVFMRLERENQKLNDKINIYEFNLRNKI